MKRLYQLLTAMTILFATLVGPALLADGDAQSEFIAEYDSNVPAAARPAIQAALDLWAASVSTEVPVVIKIEWDSLPPYVAGGSEPLGFATDPQTGFQIPIALANARAGVDLDPAHDDIRLVFSNRENWNYNVGAPAAAGQTDMMSFTLHEVGHGIGFYSSSHKDAGIVVFGSPNGEGAPGPTLLDGMLMTTVGTMLVDQHPVANLVSNLKTVLTGQEVVWGGDARDANGNRPEMSSGAFEPHTSLMHLDENTYPAGSADSLMTPTIKRGETARSIGPAAMGIMHDLGWTVTSSGASSGGNSSAPPSQRVARPATAATQAAATPQVEAATPTTIAETPTTEADAPKTPRHAAGKTAGGGGGGGSSVSPIGILVAALVLAAIGLRVAKKVRRVSEFVESIGLGKLLELRFPVFAQFAGIDD